MKRIVVIVTAALVATNVATFLLFSSSHQNRAIELGTAAKPGASCRDWGARRGSDDVDQAYCEHAGFVFWCKVSASTKPTCEVIGDQRGGGGGGEQPQSQQPQGKMPGPGAGSGSAHSAPAPMPGTGSGSANRAP